MGKEFLCGDLGAHSTSRIHPPLPSWPACYKDGNHCFAVSVCLYLEHSVILPERYLVRCICCVSAVPYTLGMSIHLGAASRRGIGVKPFSWLSTTSDKPCITISPSCLDSCASSTPPQTLPATSWQARDLPRTRSRHARPCPDG